ncbi:MAG: magnesium/cobalt transporter CorA [Gemmatimonadetes bacterium]|nr:magnesium/cobalt transporter CorA [Gemmatimonadota bacterium]
MALRDPSAFPAERPPRPEREPAAPTARVTPRVYFVDEDGGTRRELSKQQLAEVVRARRGQLWLDIDAAREEEWLLLSEIFRFHPLAIEDTRSPQGRVKFEEYEGYVFVVVRGIRFAHWTPDPYDIETINLNVFLGSNFLVTVHSDAMPSIETVAERLDAGAEALGRGVGQLMHMALDTLVDLYFPLLDEIDSFVDELEGEIFGGKTADVMERIFGLKRSLLALRRHLAPMREVMATLANRPNPFLKPETQVYFRDVYDHVVRQVESVEMYRDLLTGAMESHLSVVSNRMNEVIKALSVIATVVLPPTFIASLYGMNFEWMPFLHSPLGFWFALVLMALITGGLGAYLWWRGWL